MDEIILRVIGNDETDDEVRERYWLEHPDHRGCKVTIIRRQIIKPINPDSPTRH
jgi:hypothetical protein